MIWANDADKRRSISKMLRAHVPACSLRLRAGARWLLVGCVLLIASGCSKNPIEGEWEIVEPDLEDENLTDVQAIGALIQFLGASGKSLEFRKDSMRSGDSFVKVRYEMDENRVIVWHADETSTVYDVELGGPGDEDDRLVRYQTVPLLAEKARFTYRRRAAEAAAAN